MRASNSGTPVKVVILPLLASFSWKQLEIDWQFANKNCYWLSRVSWALAQISCYVRIFLISLICRSELKSIRFTLSS